MRREFGIMIMVVSVVVYSYFCISIGYQDGLKDGHTNGYKEAILESNTSVVDSNDLTDLMVNMCGKAIHELVDMKCPEVYKQL